MGRAKQIFITLDFDYAEDLDYIPAICKELSRTPATFFLVGKHLPIEPIQLNDNIEVGNHTFDHLDWDTATPLEKLTDLLKNHELLSKHYWWNYGDPTWGVRPPYVYRSPHLRHDKEVEAEMKKFDYASEIPVSKCPFCLDQYFSSHHCFESQIRCPKPFLEGFEELCKISSYVNFFFDPHHYIKGIIKDIIKIGKKYGSFNKISEYSPRF